MLRYLFVVLLLVTVAGAAYVGCGPRAAVAGKKVLAEIDKVLGKLNVQLEKVEQAHSQLSKDTENMRKEQIRAQVNLDRFTESKTGLEAKVASYKKDLGRLNDFMNDAKSTGTVEINGNQVSADKLEILAQSTIKKLKATQRELDRNNTLSDAWSKSLVVLKNNFKTSESQLTKLDDQIEEIKAKKSALDTMKEASTIAGNEASISDKFSDLTADVDDLLTEVNIEMLVETEKVEERMASQEADVSLDEILGSDSTTDATQAEIDAILGN